MLLETSLNVVFAIPAGEWDYVVPVTAICTGAQMSCLHCSTFFPFFVNVLLYLWTVRGEQVLYLQIYDGFFMVHFFKWDVPHRIFNCTVQAVINSVFLTTKTILSLQSLQRVNTFMFVNVQYFNLCPIPIVAIVHISYSISIGLNQVLTAGSCSPLTHQTPSVSQTWEYQCFFF